MTKPTPAQLIALKLAQQEPTGIRYYKGGWYSIPAEAGADQRDHLRHVGSGVGEHVTANTLIACEARGWLALASVRPLDGIYSTRWTLTDAGAAELARVTKEKPVRIVLVEGKDVTP